MGSWHSYNAGRELFQQDWPFYAMIQAAMRKADTQNLRALQAAFPDTWADLDARYNAPGGFLPGEAPEPTPERHRDGPDQREADLPDPNVNTFDPAAEGVGRRRR